MNWLTMKVLQYIAGALLLACIGLAAKGCALAAERDNALLEAELADVEREAVGAEREAWKAKAADLIAANKAYDVACDQLQAAAAEKPRLAGAPAPQAPAAGAAAQRDEAKAERELGEYRRLFGKKPKDCEAALQALDRVCPTLGGY